MTMNTFGQKVVAWHLIQRLLHMRDNPFLHDSPLAVVEVALKIEYEEELGALDVGHKVQN